MTSIWQGKLTQRVSEISDLHIYLIFCRFLYSKSINVCDLYKHTIHLGLTLAVLLLCIGCRHYTRCTRRLIKQSPDATFSWGSKVLKIRAQNKYISIKFSN